MSLPLLSLIAVLQQTVAIENVTVIDGTGAPARAHVTVVTHGDRIASIGPAASARVPGGARRIDGRGKYLLPGFVDAHAHVAFGPVHFDSSAAGLAMRMEYDHAASREMLGTLLAFGVTAVRNPAGPTAHAVAIRDSVERGWLLGPRIRTAGDVIDALTAPGLAVGVRSEAEIRAEVDRQAAAGVDFIKLYAGLAPPLIAAGVDQAHRRGKRAIGHLFFTSWTDAARAGIDGIVHVVPGSPQLLPADRRAAYLRTITGTQFMATWFRFVDLESPEIEEMTNLLVEKRVILDLTLTTFEAMFHGNDSAIVTGEHLKYAPPSLLDNWRSGMRLSRGWSASDYDSAQAVWPTVLRFAKHLFDKGVTLTVGTDVPNPWVPPGISLHREMELYADAGIPAADVLQMATRNGAKALGLDGEIGTITVGKRADLVLLEADPLADIRNTRRIELVILGGRPMSPDDVLPARLRIPAGEGAALTAARRVVAAMVRAVEERDGRAMLGLYAQSGAVTTFQGRMVTSRDSLAMLLSTWQPGNGPSMRLTWEDLRFTPSGPDAVAVTGRFRFVTSEMRAVAGSDTVRGVWTGLIARDGDRWAIVHEHESFANPPGNPPGNPPPQ